MKFLDFLLGRGRNKPDDNVVEPEFVTNPRKFKRVPKWTHGGKKGKDIYCPECGKDTHVSHFGWSALACPECHAEVDKYDWLMPKDKR
jgi:hypothetical protein|tara:strand:+ start:262 stop:525 length:264 start_codon:yes stop_codon:yes gene_type:complete